MHRELPGDRRKRLISDIVRQFTLIFGAVGIYLLIDRRLISIIYAEKKYV